MIVADFIKQINKNLIILSVDMLQFDSNIIGTAECQASEEKRRVIILIKYLAVLIFDNGSKLLQITNHKQLDTAKWKVMDFVSSQGIVDSIESIGPDHTYLINYEQVKTFDYIDLFTAHFKTCKILLFRLFIVIIFR